VNWVTGYWDGWLWVWHPRPIQLGCPVWLGPESWQLSLLLLGVVDCDIGIGAAGILPSHFGCWLLMGPTDWRYKPPCLYLTLATAERIGSNTVDFTVCMELFMIFFVLLMLLQYWERCIVITSVSSYVCLPLLTYISLTTCPNFSNFFECVTYSRGAALPWLLYGSVLPFLWMT